MVKYTWDDIIINPNSEEAKACIGKNVYYSNNPIECLRSANNNSKYFAKLNNLNYEFIMPFIVNVADFISSESNFACIIPKKEELKLEYKYVPFDTIKEFIKASLEHNKNHVLSSTGIWLEEKTFDKNGELEDYYIYNIDSFDMINNIVFSGETNFNFSQLLKSKATFLDGTPCGKLKE